MVDFEDAFYKVPLMRAEQKYFCVYYKSKWYVWSRVGQGSLNGPTLFGSLAAFVGRLSQSLMDEKEGRLEIYCDDPVATILATEKRARRISCILIVAWLCMGFGLSCHKGQFGYCVVWVGYELRSLEDKI